VPVCRWKTGKTRVAIQLRSRLRKPRQLRAAQGFSYEQVQYQTGLSQQLLFDAEQKSS
jgi:hypothetical protein